MAEARSTVMDLLLELKIVTNGKFRPAYHGHNWKTKKSRCLAPYLRLMGIKILQKLTKVRQRSVMEDAAIPRMPGHITFCANASSLIRNEQVVGSSPIASSSDFKASEVSRELFCCLPCLFPCPFFQKPVM